MILYLTQVGYIRPTLLHFKFLLSKVVIKKETENRFIEIKKEDEAEDRFIEIKQEEKIETLNAMLVDDSNSNLASCSFSAPAANHRGQSRTATSTPERVQEATPAPGVKKIMKQVQESEEACKAFLKVEQKYEALLIKKFRKDFFMEKVKENQFSKKHRKRGREEGEGIIKDELVLPKRAVLKLTGLGGKTTKEDIKEVLKEQFGVNIAKHGGDIAFITYEKGESEANIRFRKEDEAKALAKAWMDQKIKGAVVVGVLLDGEEEEKFLAESAQDRKIIRLKIKPQGARGKNGIRGGGLGCLGTQPPSHFPFKSPSTDIPKFPGYNEPNQPWPAVHRKSSQIIADLL